MMARLRTHQPRKTPNARGRLTVRWWRSLAAVALTVLTATVAAAQPPSGNFFPFPPAAQSFDPKAVLSAADDAGSRRHDARAFAGLAEAVQVDLLTGEATSRVAIEVPPGRKGSTPELALSYKSGAGNGLFGRGWDLRVPCVKRDTRRGVPDPFNFDAFVVILPSGSVVLDHYLGNSGASLLWGSNSEEILLRAAFDTIANTWTVTTKSGVTYTFGAGAASAATRAGLDITQIWHTFAWGVTQASDPSGNTISYQYKDYGLDGVSNAYLYPGRIDYGANAAAGYSNIFHSCFAYDSSGTSCSATPAARPDRLVDYLGGYAAEVAHRVSGIKVWVDGETTESAPTRRYALTYIPDDLSGESLLQRVDLYNDQAQTLTPATFIYTLSGEGLATTTQPMTFSPGRLTAPLSLMNLSGQVRSDLIDMTGDGRLDFVEPGFGGSGFSVYRNLGSGGFGPLESWTGPPPILHNTLWDLVDLNGDALPDAVRVPIQVVDAREWEVWYNTGSSFNGPHTWIVPIPPSIQVDDAQVAPVNPLGSFGGTFDLNGDGLRDVIEPSCNCGTYPPEYCPGQEGFCRVYFNSGTAFEAPGELWGWPNIAFGPGLTSLSDQSEGRSDLTLQDLTGDGLPDMVVSRLVSAVGLTGKKCHGGGSLHRQSCTSDANCGTGMCIDFDQSWGLYVNTGSGFAFEGLCNAGSRKGLSCVTDPDCPGVGAPVCEHFPSEYWAAPTRVNGSAMPLNQDCKNPNTAHWPPFGVEGALRDMNADGLVDYVDSNVNCNTPTAGGPWRVFINTGSGFASFKTWNGTAGLLVQKHTDTGSSGRDVIADTRDLDGDGIPEYIEAPVANATKFDVRSGLGDVPGRLKKQENGLGASMEVAYARASDTGSFAPATAAVCFGGTNDGQLCDAGCGGGTCAMCTDCDHSPFPLTVVRSLTTRTGFTDTGHTLTKHYRYVAPYYDWEEREFRGFRWAIEEDQDAGRKRAAQFIQPGAHPSDPVTACALSAQGCVELAAKRPYKGKLKYTRTTSSSPVKVWAETTATWETASITDQRHSGVQTTVVRLAEQTETLYGSSASVTTKERKLQYSYDAANAPLNNVSEMRRYADGVLVSKTQTAYEYKSTPWVMDRPDIVILRAPDDGQISRSEYDYDSRGNLTQHREWLNASPLGGAPDTITRSTVQYTGSAGTAGQPTSVIDARNNTTTLSYKETDAPTCDTYGLYPCKITRPLDLITRRTYRVEFGTVVAETDPNGATVKYQYDRFGRLTHWFRPLQFDQDPSTILAWRKLTYVLGSPGSGGGAPTPSHIDTEIREPNHATNFRKEVRFFDGLGRALETKAERIVDGLAKTIVRDGVGFDAAGRADRRYVPYVAAASLTQYEAPTGAKTTSVFDKLDRVTQVTKPDDNQVVTIYDPAGTTEMRDENYIACNGSPGSVDHASCPGKRTIEQRDALGRLVNIKVYKGQATLDNETVNEYDAADRLSITQIGADTNTKVTFTYDSLGRRIRLIDKDSGTWRYGYDHADNLVFQDDPNQNQHLETCFDPLNRPFWKVSFSNDTYSGNSCANGLFRTVFGYDTCPGGKGRLCLEYGPNRYNLERTYDARGRVVTEERTVQAAGLTRTLLYDITYDDADRLKTVNYPTSLNDEIEPLTYGYNAAGQLVSAATPGNFYLSAAMYDVFGRPKDLSLAFGALHEQRTYFAASANFRLSQIAVMRSGTALQQWNYSASVSEPLSSGYDRAGNLLNVTDVTATAQYPAFSGRDNDWQYTYDGLGRLTSAAWGAVPTTATFAYTDGLGNMTEGNLAFPNINASTTVTFTHHATRRHHIDTMNPPGTGFQSTYESGGANGDGNGGLTSRSATVSGDIGKTIAYDIDGRVDTVTVSGTGDSIESVYDDHGERIARIVNDTDVTFFFGRYVEVHGSQLTRHFYAGDRRIAFSPIPAPPSLTLAALSEDHPAVLLARLKKEKDWLDTLPPLGADIRPVASAGGLAVLLIGTIVLGIAPGYARVGFIRRVRRGRVAILILVYVVTLPAWPAPQHRSGSASTAWACPPGAPSAPSYIVHVDHLGSATLLTSYKLPNEPTDGAVMQYYRYGPYGKMQAYDRNGNSVANGSEATELTYTGQRWDSKARLYYYGARFYDPMIARFMNTDPAREYMNLYAYVRWSPTRFGDPSGMFMTEMGLVAALNGDPGRAIGIPLEFENLGGGLDGTTSDVPGRGQVNSPQAEFQGSIQAAGLAAAKGAISSAVAAEAGRQGGDTLSVANPFAGPASIDADAPPIGTAYPGPSAFPSATDVLGLLMGVTAGLSIGGTGLAIAYGAAIDAAHLPGVLSSVAATPGFTSGVLGASLLGLTATTDIALLFTLAPALAFTGGAVAGMAINDFAIAPILGGPTYFK